MLSTKCSIHGTVNSWTNKWYENHRSDSNQGTLPFVSNFWFPLVEEFHDLKGPIEKDIHCLLRYKVS